MPLTLFTVTGCLRCAVLKQFLAKRTIAFQEKDVKEQGKSEFTAFYAQNRPAIRRTAAGIEFPILADGAEIRQGLGPALAYLLAGKGLDGYIGTGTLTGKWIDGLSVSDGDPGRWEAFLEALRHLKGSGMQVELYTDGRQAWILQKIQGQDLADRVVMDVFSPPGFYEKAFGSERMEKDLSDSLKCVSQFPDYVFRLVCSAVSRKDGKTLPNGFLAPAEIGEAAKKILEATGSGRHPCFVAEVPYQTSQEVRKKSLPSVQQKDLFRYRSEARRFQVFTEIEPQQRS